MGTAQNKIRYLLLVPFRGLGLYSLKYAIQFSHPWIVSKLIDILKQLLIFFNIYKQKLI